MTNGMKTTTPAMTRLLARRAPNDEALAPAKRELTQAEGRLAKARATVVSTEIDLKALTARLRERVR